MQNQTDILVLGQKQHLPSALVKYIRKGRRAFPPLRILPGNLRRNRKKKFRYKNPMKTYGIVFPKDFSLGEREKTQRKHSDQRRHTQELSYIRSVVACANASKINKRNTCPMPPHPLPPPPPSKIKEPANPILTTSPMRRPSRPSP